MKHFYGKARRYYKKYWIITVGEDKEFAIKDRSQLVTASQLRDPGWKENKRKFLSAWIGNRKRSYRCRKLARH